MGEINAKNTPRFADDSVAPRFTVYGNGVIGIGASSVGVPVKY